jgi:hypothetical protein
LKFQQGAEGFSTGLSTTVYDVIIITPKIFQKLRRVELKMSVENDRLEA